MDKKYIHWQMAGFVATGIVGTLLHFLFDWTNEAAIAGFVSAVNESIWEHMKLLFWPLFLFAIVEYWYWGRCLANFWWVKLLGILSGLAWIPLLYYTYTGALGRSADWFNIAIFYLAAAWTFRWETSLLQKERCRNVPGWVALSILCLLAGLFVLWTFLPPRIPLFQDPQTGSYGFH